VPDIFVESVRDNTLLIIEAKGGGVDPEQADRYSELTPERISNTALSKISPKQLKIEICYACTKDNLKDVLSYKKKAASQGKQFNFPIVYLDGLTFRYEENSYPFQEENLKRCFSQAITFKREPSDKNFPFGEGDSGYWIAQCLIGAMIRKFDATRNENGKRFKREELMRASHPLFDSFGDDEHDVISKATYKVLHRLANPPEDLENILPVKQYDNDYWQVLRHAKRKLLQWIDKKYSAEIEGQTLDTYTKGNSVPIHL
jgi:hypothetical protein